MILIPLITYGQGGFGVDSNKTIDNGKIRFGNGSQVSLDGKGMGRQPFIKKAGGGYIKLTYSSNPLNYAYGVGGTGTGVHYPWNTNGTVTADLTMSSQQFNTSGFTYYPTGQTSKGYGTITVSGTITVGSKNLQVNNTYSLGQNDSYVKVTTSVKNINSSAVTNLRYWVGTKDDAIGAGGSGPLKGDRPRKTRGNIVGGDFQALTDPNSNSSALLIQHVGTSIASHGDGVGYGVLFFTNSSRGNTLSQQYNGNFSQVTNNNPKGNQIVRPTGSQSGDGAYGMFVRMNDLAAGASDSFTWFYAAAPVTELNDVTSQIANASINIDNITKTYGDNAFTISATSSSTGAITYSAVNSSVATITSNTVTITGAGTTSVSVSQAADSNYSAATTTITLTVNPLSITITPTASQSKNYGAPDSLISFSFTPTITTNSSVVTFTSILYYKLNIFSTMELMLQMKLLDKL